MAPALPRDLPASQFAFLREISARLTDGVRFGPRWRARERRYPAADSPVCLVFEVAVGTSWRPVAAYDPTGAAILGVIDADTLQGHAADYFARADHTHGSVETPTYTTATRPAAASDAPSIIRVKDAGQPGQLQACVQQSGGTWEWVIIALASQ